MVKIYEELKRQIARGWNTWNTRSVLSHVLLPEGFALNLGIKEYRQGQYLKEALIGRFGKEDEKIHPGAHAYDGSYTELNLMWQGIELVVQTAAWNDDLYILVTPLANQLFPPKLVIESGMLWNRPGTLKLDGDSILAELPSCIISVHVTKPAQFEPSVATQTPYLAVELNGPVGICTGRSQTLEAVQAIIELNRDRHSRNKLQYGELSEVYNAMQSCMAWDTIYEPQKDRVVTPVSRLWNLNFGGYVLFCWDNYFAAYLASIDNKALAYCNAIEMTREKTADGFVPNYACNSRSSRDRSQPPVGSMVVRELYRRYQEKWLLEELFEDLFNWNTWYFENRSLNNNALAWGSNPCDLVYGNYWETAGVNDTYGGALESGLDNSPMYDDIPFDKERHRMMLADVGLTGLYILDCMCLADIAHVIGKSQEAAELENRSQKCSAGLQSLWNESKGIFMNKRTDTDDFSDRLSPTHFYALFSSTVTEEQANRMIQEHFYNPDEFWGDWILPSISRDDPAFREQDYWRGRIWGPMNFLVYLGLRRHRLGSASKDLAEKSKALILKEWLEHGHVHENYSAITGSGCDVGNSDKFYHWGGLLSMIALIDAGFMEGPEKRL